jgi:hypothetical protein
MSEVEYHHIGGLLSNDIQTMPITACNQTVISIHKLYVFTPADIHSLVTGYTQSLIALPQVDNLVAKVDDLV